MADTTPAVNVYISQNSTPPSGAPINSNDSSELASMLMSLISSPVSGLLDSVSKEAGTGGYLANLQIKGASGLLDFATNFQTNTANGQTTYKATVVSTGQTVTSTTIEGAVAAAFEAAAITAGLTIGAPEAIGIALASSIYMAAYYKPTNQAVGAVLSMAYDAVQQQASAYFGTPNTNPAVNSPVTVTDNANGTSTLSLNNGNGSITYPSNSISGVSIDSSGNVQIQHLPSIGTDGSTQQLLDILNHDGTVIKSTNTTQTNGQSTTNLTGYNSAGATQFQEQVVMLPQANGQTTGQRDITVYGDPSLSPAPITSGTSQQYAPNSVVYFRGADGHLYTALLDWMTADGGYVVENGSVTQLDAPSSDHAVITVRPQGAIKLDSGDTILDVTPPDGTSGSSGDSSSQSASVPTAMSVTRIDLDYTFKQGFDSDGNLAYSQNTTTDSNGQVTIDTKYYDKVTGGLTQEIIVNPDGSSVSTSYDPATSLPLITITLGNKGQITSTINPDADFTQFKSSVATALASQVIAQFLFKHDLPASMLAQAFTTTSIKDLLGTLPKSTSDAFNNLTAPQQFLANYGISLASIAAGIGGSIAGADLFQTLGLPPQVGSVIGQTLSQQVVDDIINNVAGTQLGVISGSALSLASIGGALQNAGAAAIGDYVGDDLGDLVIGSPNEGSTFGGAVGGAIGSAAVAYAATAAGQAAVSEIVGVSLGAFICGPIGVILVPAVGAFLGTIIGSIFGPGKSVGPDATAVIAYNAATHSFSTVSNNADNGGDTTISSNMAAAADQELNGILSSIGGTATILSSMPVLGIGYYQQRGMIALTDGPYYNDPQAAIDKLVVAGIANMQIKGGNPYMEYALAHSGATTAAGFITALNTAYDYGNYLSNPLAFDTALAMANSSTQFDTWMTEMQEAQAMGLADAPGAANLNGTVLTDTAAYVTSNLEIINDFITSNEITQINLTDSGTPVLTLTAAQASQYAGVLNDISGSYDLITNNTDGTSQEKFANPFSTIASEITSYSGTNATGTITQNTINWVAGGSQKQVFSNLSSGVSEEIFDYSSANVVGSPIDEIINNTNGTSQEWLYSGNSNLFNGATSELETFAGTNATGTMTNLIYNWSNGTSQENIYTGLASGVFNEVLEYSGANLTGTLTTEYINYNDGTSKMPLLTGLFNGATSEYETFSQMDGNGTLTSLVYNWNNGTSQRNLYTGIPSNAYAEIQYYAGADLTGGLTLAYVDYNDGSSQVQKYTNLPGGGSVASEYDLYTQANGNGTETDYIYNFTNGTSQKWLLTDRFGGTTSEYENFSGIGATGALTMIEYNWTNGTSQANFYAGLPSGVFAKVVGYSGTNMTGSVTSTAYSMASGNDGTLTASNSTIYINNANTQMTVSGTGDTVYATSSDTITVAAGSSVTINGSGLNIVAAAGDNIVLNGNAGTNTITGSGAYTLTVNGSNHGNGNNYGTYGFAGNEATVAGALNADNNIIVQQDIASGDTAGAQTATTALQQLQEVIATGSTATVLEGATWSKNVITWDAASNMAAYQGDIQAAFDAWGVATGLTFKEVSDPAQADINLNFSDLNTATSGVVGYTNYTANNGQMNSANIEIETPAALAGSTYSGTNATLQQVLEHEIGHALGFGDSNNSSSIMNYTLTSQNQSLSSQDIASAQSIYGSASTEATYLKLVQDMASFGSTTGYMASASTVPEPYMLANTLTVNPAIKI